MNGCARLLEEFKQQGVQEFTSGREWVSRYLILRNSQLENEDVNLPRGTLEVRSGMSYDLEAEHVPSQESHVQARSSKSSKADREIQESWTTCAAFGLRFHLESTERKFLGQASLLAGMRSFFY